MSDYIKREDVINIVCDACNDKFSEEPCEPPDCAIFNVLKEYPAANVIEQRYGKWLMKGLYEGRCSECGFTQIGTHYNNTYVFKPDIYRYCPCCGARMVT